MYADGYKYWFAFKTDKTSYYRCCRYITSKCPGKCTNDDGKIKTTSQHNHPPEPNRALVDKFRKTLTNRAATETTLSLYSIYCDEATNRHAEASLLYPFQSAESAMRKARRKKLPQPSNNLNNIIDILDSTDLFRVHSGNSKDPLYQKTITLDDCICMIFMHRKTYDLLGHIDEIHIDSSFEFIIQNSPTYYLTTFHAIQGQVNAPILYCISTAKNQSAYSAIFSYIRDELKLNPNVIISDFNHIVQSTLSFIFPQAILKGNWFHYTDSILTKILDLGIKTELTKGISSSCLKMLLVLPLLPPEYMRNGLESIKKWMNEKLLLTDGLLNLCDFIENFWLRKYGCEKISIFGTTSIVSNHIKNFNRNLADYIGTKNPVIWVILDSLTQLSTKIFLKISRKLKNLNDIQKSCNNKIKKFNSININNTNKKKLIKKNNFFLHKQNLVTNLNDTIILPIKRYQNNNEIISEEIIDTATQVWIKTPVHLRNPLQYLKLISHCINDTMYLDSLSGIKEHNYLLNMKNNLNFNNIDLNLIKSTNETNNSNSNNNHQKNIDINLNQKTKQQFDNINSNQYNSNEFNSNRNYGNNNSNSSSNNSNSNNINVNNSNSSNSNDNIENNNNNNNNTSKNFDTNNQDFSHTNFSTNLQNFSTNHQHDYNSEQNVYERNQHVYNSNQYNNQSYDNNMNYKNNSSNTNSNDSDNYNELITNGNGLITSNGDLISNWNSTTNNLQTNRNLERNSNLLQRNSYSIQTISNNINSLEQSNSSNHIITTETETSRTSILTAATTVNLRNTNCYTQHSQTELNDTEQNVNSLIETHLNELQNSPASPSLSIILAEGTFNCASITHQEFLLAQPGQSLDLQQNQIQSCCFAQNQYINNNIDSDNSFIFSFNDDNIITNSIRPTLPATNQPTKLLSNNNNLKKNLLHKKYNSIEPPPLVFFPSVKRLTCKRTLPILSQPPPLVPIGSNKFRRSPKRLIKK